MEKRLGKGISALIPESENKTDGISNLTIDSIVPNKNQPRKSFNEEKLKDLISSIREKGVIQPVVVRTSDNGYELIAGERRFRAARELGFSHIPAIVKNVNDADSLELSLIENIQREELNSIEEANAYKQLIEQFSFSQDDVAKAVGKDKSTVSNSLRLLTLPKEVQRFVEDNLISTGHAKAILALSNDRQKIKFANHVIRRSLSVRQTEELVKAKLTAEPKKTQAKDNNIVYLEERMQHALGTRVKVVHGKKRGRIEIDYYSNEDLERIVNIIAKQ